jgi:hypothetical protein
MAEISKKVIKEVTHLLPEVRKEVKKELSHWKAHYDCGCKAFNSDKHFIKSLPSAVYEYIIMVWGIEPGRVTSDSAIEALNERIFKDVRKITAHGLRRLAFKNSGK